MIYIRELLQPDIIFIFISYFVLSFLMLFFSERIIKWENKQYYRFKRWLHRRLNSNKKVVQWARPKKGRKRANIGDYDAVFENVWSNQNLEKKYSQEDFRKDDEE